MNQLFTLLKFALSAGVFNLIVICVYFAYAIKRLEDPIVLFPICSISIILSFFLRKYVFYNENLKIKFETYFLYLAYGLAIITFFTYGQTQSYLISCPLLSFYLGIHFWLVNSREYEFIDWLSSPLEYGKVPDEIHCVLKKTVTWNGYSEKCYVYKFRYEDQWSGGITGPITFSLLENRLGSMSGQEILDAHKEWYQKEKKHLYKDRDN